EALPLVEPLEPVIEATPVAEEPAPPAEPAAPPAPCPICGSERVPGHATCPDCGFHFPDDTTGPAPAPLAPAHRVQTRYEVGALICEHRGVARYRARDLGLGGTDSVPVVLVRQAAAAPPPAKQPAPDDEDIIPDFDSLPSTDVTEVMRQRPDWPGVLWERYL